MEKAYKFRLYPNTEQKELLAKTFGCARFVYNYYLDRRIKAYQQNKTTMNCNACSADLTKLKQEKPWLKEVDKFALQNALKDLDRAFQNFFREIKKGNKNQGFPKLKSKHHYKQSYRTTFTNNNIKVEKNRIKLPKLGWVDMIQHRDIQGRIVNCTITKTCSDEYYVSICCTDVVIDKYESTENSIGIDLGLKEFITTSDGEVIENPKYLLKLEKKLKREQRKLSKKQKGSKNIEKQRIRLNKVHKKIRNQRIDFLQKLSTRIIQENQLIISEDLNVKGMVQNHRLAKAINDVSWSEFARMIEYKANWYGRTYHKINRFYASSQTCNVCGYKNVDIKDLNIRQWICPQCNTKHDRDNNAAINILNQGLKELGLTA